LIKTVGSITSNQAAANHLNITEMKKMFFPLLFLFASLLTTQAQTTTDEAAIKAVCETETKAWIAGDTKGMRACFKVQPYSMFLLSLPDGTHSHESAEEMKANMDKEVVSVFPDATFVTSNHRIHASGDMGWLTYDQVITSKDGTLTHTHELRIVEKHSGAWKVVGASVHGYKP
jgi:ketosteroid isomerase-like protein